MTRVSIVPPHHVDDLWHLVAPHLAEALERGGGDYDTDDARGFVAGGTWQLWIATQPGRLVLAALTEVVEYPRHRVMWCVAAGGEMAEAMPVVEPAFRAHAVRRGAVAVRFLGRRGWMRSGAMPADWKHTLDVATVEV